MVCPRCIKVVREELEKLGINIKSIILGEVEIEQSNGKIPLEKILIVLNKNGFELIEDSKAKIIERIKKKIISAIQQYDKIDLEKINFSNYLSDIFRKEYHFFFCSVRLRPP